MLLLLLAVCLWSLVKKRAELFRFRLCPDFVVSCFRWEVEYLLLLLACHLFSRGAGSEGFNLTGLSLWRLWLMKKKRKEKQHPTFSPVLAAYWAQWILLLIFAWWSSCEQNALRSSATVRDDESQSLPLSLSRLWQQCYNKMSPGRLSIGKSAIQQLLTSW